MEEKRDIIITRADKNSWITLPMRDWDVPMPAPTPIPPAGITLPMRDWDNILINIPWSTVHEDYITYEGLRQDLVITLIAAFMDYITYEGLRRHLSTIFLSDSYSDYITYEGLRHPIKQLFIPIPISGLHYLWGIETRWLTYGKWWS